MTRLLRKLRELFVGLYSAITMPRWNPYGGQAREACGLPLACVICGKDSAENISHVCEECRILAREGVVRVPEAKGEPQWFEPGWQGPAPKADFTKRPHRLSLGIDCLGCAGPLSAEDKAMAFTVCSSCVYKVVKGPWS